MAVFRRRPEDASDQAPFDLVVDPFTGGEWRFSGAGQRTLRIKRRSTWWLIHSQAAGRRLTCAAIPRPARHRRTSGGCDGNNATVSRARRSHPSRDFQTGRKGTENPHRTRPFRPLKTYGFQKRPRLYSRRLSFGRSSAVQRLYRRWPNVAVYRRLFVGIERPYLHALPKGEHNEGDQENSRA
jgi:hypothetical protein